MKPLTSFSKNFIKVKRYISSLQKVIREGLENVGKQDFKEIPWKYHTLGGGKSLLIDTNIEFGLHFQPSRVIKNRKNKTDVFEKAGVNVSAVGGDLPLSMKKLFKTQASLFSACGLSLVIHPHSPMIPTVHMNVRYLEMSNGEFWFGGGIDLTPYYPAIDDFQYFHKVIRESVVKIYPERYQEFKEKCDSYFTLPHRGEMRGVGGVFFDYLKNDFHRDFSLIRSLGDSFLDSYLPLVKKNLKKNYGKMERQFQLYRRGRYVEFNLLYDRGTLFGLKTGGRVDSILMSLPSVVYFPSGEFISKNSFESQMNQYYQPHDWLKNQS